ncbi:MAG: 3-keto-disaccharide hydrolase [Cyclonatronaceae bacterium]
MNSGLLYRPCSGFSSIFFNISLACALLLSVPGCQAPAPETSAPAAEWISLFDGSAESFEQSWRVYNQDGLPDYGWQIEEELLVFRPPQKEEWTSGLDIITRETFEDFELELEWMVTEAGNSGIFYHVLEQPTQEIYWSGLEMQILDNENHPDADMGEDGNRRAGSLYDLIPAEPQNARPFGEWNQVRIVSEGNTVQHYQNGALVVEYERFTPEWFEMLRNSKFRDHNEFGAIRNGHIGLQDHGDVVMFRNMRIRRL